MDQNALFTPKFSVGRSKQDSKHASIASYGSVGAAHPLPRQTFFAAPQAPLVQIDLVIILILQRDFAKMLKKLTTYGGS
jgi:hypothetical protein